MGVGFDRPQIVDRHDFEVAPAALHDRPQYQAPDAPEAVDRYANGHSYLLARHGAPSVAGTRSLALYCLFGSGRRRFRRDAEMLVHVLVGPARAERIHADK